MTKRNVSAPQRAYGVVPTGRRRDRGALLLSTALGCSLLVAAPGMARAQVAADIVIDRDYSESTADLTPAISASDGHNVTITSGEAVTEGDGSPGIYVANITGDVTIDSGLITTSGGLMVVGDFPAISAGIAVLDGENVAITSDQITTTGGGAFGIAVEDVATISITSGQITTSGDAATGITAGADGAISITSESIATVGGPVAFEGEWVAAEGIFAESNGPISIDSGTISTEGDLAHGILAEGGEGAISIVSGTITTAGDNAQGILATSSTGDITIAAGTTATTGDYNGDPVANPYSYFPDAVTAITGSGAISIISETASADGLYASAVAAVATGGGDIVINSGVASGSGNGGVVLQADADYAPGSDVTIVSESILNEGDGKGSLTAVASGDVVVQSGSIVSTGDAFYDSVRDETLFSNGLFAYSSGGDVTVESGSISTVGDFARGLAAFSDTGSVTVTSGSITTQSARGLQARAAGDINIDSGSIHTAAPNEGHAIMVTAGAGDVNIVSDEIVTEGPTSHGIYVANAGGPDIGGIGAYRPATGGTGTLTIQSGSIESSGYGMMIDHQGAIDITSGSIVSGVSGVYLYGGDAITIDSGSVETTNGAGIIAWGDDGVVTINSDSVLVGQGGDVGVYGRTSTGDIFINAGETTTTATGLLFGSYTADAVGATSQTGDITIVSGSASTVGVSSSGIYGVTGGSLSITSGSITNAGDNGNGILALANGGISIDSGVVHTTGNSNIGMIVDANTSDGDIVIVSDEIVTEGAYAHGIYVADNNGADIPGIGAWRAATGGTGDLTITSGSIEVTGYGMMIDHQGAIDITSDSIVSGGPGIYLYGGDTITIDAGSISTTNGPGIVAWGDDALVHITTGDILVGANGDVGVVGRTTTGDVVINAGTTETTATGLLFDNYTADAVFGWSTSGDVTITSAVARTQGLYSTGVLALTGGDVSITSGVVENDGLLGNGVYAEAGGAVTIDSGSIAMSGNGAWGLYVDAGGPVSVVSDSVTTTGAADELENGLGISVTAGSRIDIDSGLVSTQGEGAFAIKAIGGGDATVTSDQITVAGDGAYGMLVDVAGSATVTSGSIVVDGQSLGEDRAFGMAVGADGDLDITSGSISTQGYEGFGIGVVGLGHVKIASNEITTAGDLAGGIVVKESSSANVTTGDVATSGAGSVAVAVVSTGAIDIDVTGDVSAAQSWGVVVKTSDDSTVNIEVASGASVIGSGGAIALEESNADTTLTVYGRLSTDADTAVLLAGGDDVINLMTGAGVEGAINALGGVDALNLNSTVNTAGTGQSLGDVIGVETITVANGYWVLGGDATADTAINGGTLVVTGTLTDDVVIAQNGTLQIGNGGATGDLVGDLVIGGTAIFNRSDEYDFGGDISGQGSLVKEGESSLILSGAYTFTGTTVVNGGTIKILHLPDTAEVVVDDGVLDLSGTEQEVASLSGGEGGTVDIDDGALTVNQEGSTEFAGSITGDGSLTLTGGGTLDLSGDNTYTGPTTIDEGTLKVNGSITSDVTVDDGGILGGSGQIGGDVTVANGGVVGPGNSPGLLTVVGDFTFAAGSTYVAEVEADGDHDQIDVSGATTIEDGVTLQILAGNGEYARLTGYTLLTSDGGVTGEFDDIETNLAFLTPHLEYELTSVQLYLTRNDVTFASFATNANQASVADVIEAAGLGDPLYDALIVQSAEGSQEGYAALSGEAYASLGSVLLVQNRYGREAILNRAATQTDGAGVWAELVSANLDYEGTTDHAAIESEARGFVAGADTAVNGWRAGAALTHISSDVTSAALATTADVKSTSVSAYVSGTVGGVKTTIGASYGRHDVDAARAVAFTGFDETAEADFEATAGEVFAELSVSQQVSGIFLQPFIGVGYATLDVDGFAEEGGDAALTVASMDRNVGTAKIGVRASASFDSGVGQVTPYASVALQGVSGDDEGRMEAAFAGAGVFTVGGAPIADGVAYDLGVRIDGERLGFTASYSGLEADEWSDQQARVGVSFRF